MFLQVSHLQQVYITDVQWVDFLLQIDSNVNPENMLL